MKDKTESRLAGVRGVVDTHCHIQFADYPLDASEVWNDAKKAGVEKILVVGDDVASSQRAVDFAKGRDGVYAVVGVHPHNSAKFLAEPDSKRRVEAMLDNAEANKIVAVGEFGLDYYYKNSPKEAQIEVLRYQLELLQRYNLPANFHIRSGLPKALLSSATPQERSGHFSAVDVSSDMPPSDKIPASSHVDAPGRQKILEGTDLDAFDDFWPIFDEFHAKSAISGVVHCFTAGIAELDEALKRGLYIALNGIMTFTKDQKQLEAAKAIPLEKLLLETDAPFLTPTPFRGKICKPEYTVRTAEFLANLRNEDLGVVTEATTENAIKLFNLK